MKTTILILALFLFSFSLESSTFCENIALENVNEVTAITVHHYIGTEGVNIVLELLWEAAAAHLLHGDDIFGDEPPVPPN